MEHVVNESRTKAAKIQKTSDETLRRYQYVKKHVLEDNPLATHVVTPKRASRKKKTHTEINKKNRENRSAQTSTSKILYLLQYSPVKLSTNTLICCHILTHNQYEVSIKYLQKLQYTAVKLQFSPI